jgi:hypothetical protein
MFKEYRFRVHNNVISCAEDIPARWPETDESGRLVPA